MLQKLGNNLKIYNQLVSTILVQLLPGQVEIPVSRLDTEFSWWHYNSFSTSNTPPLLLSFTKENWL